MNFKNLSDSELLFQTKKAACTEKEALLALLEYLCEVDRRKLYAVNYSSLHEFISVGLGYSGAQASERVNAVRLMRQNPEVKTHLETGKLTLTSASKIQRFIQTENKVSGVRITADKKDEIISSCLGESKRDVTKVLFEFASPATQNVMQEKVRAVSKDRVELKFTIGSETEEKLKRIQELVSANSLEEIFDQALGVFIAAEEKKRGFLPDGGNRKTSKVETSAHTKISNLDTKPKLSGGRPPKNIYSRYTPVNFKGIIGARSKGQCEYVRGKFRCNSRYRLQKDHVIPLALGGTTTLENLRHLCANHNQRAGMEMGVIKTK